MSETPNSSPAAPDHSGISGAAGSGGLNLEPGVELAPGVSLLGREEFHGPRPIAHPLP